MASRFIFLLAAAFLATTHWLPNRVRCEEPRPNGRDAGDAYLVRPEVTDFVVNHCLDCHDGDASEGGFDATLLSNDLSKNGSIETWVRVFDRVHQGEMPPQNSVAFEPNEKDAFVTSAAQDLLRYQSELHRRQGRVQARRLTNVQLERTLQDLLHIDIPLARLIPAEQRSGGFVHLANAQSMSHFHLQSHLTVVDAALDEAFRRAQSLETDWILDIGPERIANKQGRQRNREPEMREGLAVVWSGGPIYYGRISNARIPRDGWYRISVTASGVRKPQDRGVWCSVRSGECVSSAPLMTWIGAFEASDEPSMWTFEAFIPQGQLLEIQPADMTLPRGRFAGGQVGVGEGETQNIPGLALHRLRIEQIHPGGDISETQSRLFGTVELTAGKRSLQPAVAGRTTDQLDRMLAQQIEAFAQLAFRRPTPSEDLQPFVQLAQDAIASGESFADALRVGYRSLLCSPRFLYFVEPADEHGHLDDWAIASRISYMICGSMPDQALRDLAEAGRLKDPSAVTAEVDRLLKTRRGKDFVKDFSSQWLDLIDIDFTEPDRRLFPDFDVVVQDGMLQETHAFLQHLLDEDRPISELVAADYTFLNSRLARYYKIPGISGDALQRVTFQEPNARGGILGHGSILKVTANGNDTSPVLRGIWVSERLLGEPIPDPPANVPAVEPDVRGATTIRELLAKHQANAECAACHRKIDPPGFALENFDAAGRWRDSYRRLQSGKYLAGAKIDPSFTMPDGQPFDSFFAFRQLVARNDAALASNLAEKLLVYGTGAELTFSDRPFIKKMLRQTHHETDEDRHGFRSILLAVVTSDPFLSK